MHIAIVGTGIAGSAAAWAIATSTRHDLTVYERDDRIGGHSATLDIDYDGFPVAVDTGFVVYNEVNYPDLTALYAHLGVKTQTSDMSFSVSARRGGFEWSGRTDRIINGLFAQRRNVLSPGFLRMLADMIRFNRAAPIDRRNGVLTRLTLRDYLALRGFSARLRDDYLVPMGAAIWSMPTARILDFPAESFVAFFENHHLLAWTRPAWGTVTGGSRRYVEALTRPFSHRVRLGTPVRRILRHDLGVDVQDESGHSRRFDQVIIAAHADQALAMLGDPHDQEREVLEPIRFCANDVYLHRDPRLMPKRRAAWSSWNVLRTDDTTAPVAVTYWMNALQGIDPHRPLFVSLNPPFRPREELTFRRLRYDHPQFDLAALAARARLDQIQGVRRTWFCGAWTGYGFHEDGLTSGLAVAETLGAQIPWRARERRMLEAAE